MGEDAGRSRLGRGLAALIGDVGDEVSALDRAKGQRRAVGVFPVPGSDRSRKRGLAMYWARRSICSGRRLTFGSTDFPLKTQPSQELGVGLGANTVLLGGAPSPTHLCLLVLRINAAN